MGGDGRCFCKDERPLLLTLLVHLEKQKGRNLKPEAQKDMVHIKKKKKFEHEKMKK